jgi:hypothetical protein
MPLLQDSIRFSKTLEASPAQLTSTVREQRAVFKEFHALENEDLPVQEPARGAPRSMGRGTDGREDGEMQLDETAAGRHDRLSGRDRRESPATRRSWGSISLQVHY